MSVVPSSAPRPLDGIRVLELGQLLAGPFAGTLLAYFGAEVIKVEPPGGDPIRQWRIVRDGASLWWRSLGRNKKCVTLNLRDPAGRALARRLAERCDVLIENFRPGTLEGWGLGPDDLKPVNPGLIFARISGYGQDGPYAARPGYASVCEGIGGLRYVNGVPGEPPVRPNLSLGDTFAGLHAAFGVLLALLDRQRRAPHAGQTVDVALYESVFNLLEAVVPEYDGAGAIREPSGSTVTGIVPTGTYRCRDGKHVIIGGNGDSIYKRLMHAAGRADLAEDPRLAGNAGRVEHQAGDRRGDCGLDGDAGQPGGAGPAGSGGGAGRTDLQRGGHGRRPAFSGARPVRDGGDRRQAAENSRHPAQAGGHAGRDRLAGAGGRPPQRRGVRRAAGAERGGTGDAKKSGHPLNLTIFVSRRRSESPLNLLD